MMKDDDSDSSDDDDASLSDTMIAGASFVEIGSKLETIRVSGSKLEKVKAGQPTAPTKNTASTKYRNRKCPINAKPNCPVLLDKIDMMEGEILDALALKTAELDKHNTYCKMIADGLNSEIQNAQNQLAVWNVELAKATAQLSGLLIAQSREEKVKHELCQELRKKYQECYTELMQLFIEICGLLKVRQAVYNRVKAPNMKPGDPQMMIVDCQMGDWVVGPCSSTCVDANGNPGIQLITRTPVIKWDPTTPEGKYGASCPPSQVQRACSDVQCPIDCAVGEWSGWSKCSKDCGGGQQGRARPVLTQPGYGGTECPETSEERLCNSGSCDVDCVLSDWSGWGACSKSCKWRSTAKPGMQVRTKGIKVATKGNGKCPMPLTRLRYQKQMCNNFVCPKDVKCVAEVDVVFVLDGSGSLYYRYGPRDTNFKRIQTFVTKMVEASELAKVDGEGRAKGGMRYGVILFSWGAQTVTQITNKKDQIISKVKAMKWPRGMTYTGRALLAAKGMFAVGSTKSRQQVVVLVTDGRASNVNRARKAGATVRSAGIRVILVPVKNGVRQQKEMCRWASKPCSENMLLTPSWGMLIAKLKWYMSTFCPVMEAK